MIEVPDITDWEAKPWYNTGGTRSKKYVERPGGDGFYFKRSEYKPATATNPEKNYRFEFWSEIIAYKVGRCLGFDVLEYIPAIDKAHVGCLCADMIDAGKEELIGGVQFLQGQMPDFDPAQNANRKLYSFQLIEAALKKYRLGQFLPNIIEMVVFDAIIGNTDRHQENWAVISDFSPTIRSGGQLLSHFIKAPVKNLTTLARLATSYIVNTLKSKAPDELQDERLTEGNKVFAPLFDNGSSLGREIADDKVPWFLEDVSRIEKFIDNGHTAIHWEGKRVKHFELLHLLYSTGHRQQMQKIMERVRQKFTGREIEDIIMHVDDAIPETHQGYRMPEARKALIHKMITSRSERLMSLYHERVR